MTHELFIDEHDPRELVEMLEPVVRQILPNETHPVIIAPLNRTGNGDVRWIDLRMNRRQWERKQLGEALSDLDGMEGQINEELRTADEQTLVVEGVGYPTPEGVALYRWDDKHRFMIPAGHIPPHRAKPQPGLAARWEGLKASLRMAGVDVVEVTGLEGTAAAIAAAYRESMKEERTTLRRYLRPHIPPFDPDPHVDNLARLKGVGVGPETAKKLVQEYRTFWGAVSAPRGQLRRVMGPQRADNFLEGIGRED